MKEQYRTPRKEQARSSELLDGRSKDSSSKKLQKITKKSLNAAFSSVSGDATETSTQSVDFSSISEIPDSDHIGEIAESFLMAANPALSNSLESPVPSEHTPSSTVTAEMDEPGQPSGTPQSGSSKAGSVEAKIVVDFLKRTRSQVLKSSDVDPQSQRIVDVLIEIVIQEIYGQPEERDHIALLVLMKPRIVLLCFFLWILAVAVFSFRSAVQNSSAGPLPT